MYDEATITVGKLKSILNNYLDSDIVVLKSSGCGFEEDHWAELYIVDKTKTVWQQDILDTEYN
jgi:hypothetical protein